MTDKFSSLSTVLDPPTQTKYNSPSFSDHGFTHPQIFSVIYVEDTLNRKNPLYIIPACYSFRNTLRFIVRFNTRSP
jgi:hypothetical protein